MAAAKWIVLDRITAQHMGKFDSHDEAFDFWMTATDWEIDAGYAAGKTQEELLKEQPRFMIAKVLPRIHEAA